MCIVYTTGPLYIYNKEFHFSYKRKVHYIYIYQHIDKCRMYDIEINKIY